AALGPRTTLIAAGTLGALVTLSCLLLPGIRTIERHHDPTADPAAQVAPSTP
ncbi:MAG: hypothetical protein QOF29_627, partial [bacterium]